MGRSEYKREQSEEKDVSVRPRPSIHPSVSSLQYPCPHLPYSRCGPLLFFSLLRPLSMGRRTTLSLTTSSLPVGITSLSHSNYRTLHSRHIRASLSRVHRELCVLRGRLLHCSRGLNSAIRRTPLGRNRCRARRALMKLMRSARHSAHSDPESL